MLAYFEGASLTNVVRQLIFWDKSSYFLSPFLQCPKRESLSIYFQFMSNSFSKSYQLIKLFSVNLVQLIKLTSVNLIIS